MLSNYHQHSSYSDGQGTLEDYVQAALVAGLKSMGFSDHAPVSFPTDWTMPLERLAAYRDEIAALKAAYSQRIELYAGLEMDYLLGQMAFQRRHVLSQPWDFIIGAVHYLEGMPDGCPWSVDENRETFEKGLYGYFAGDIRRVIDLYYATVRDMVKAGGITIVAHLDYIKHYNDRGRYFPEEAGWYRRFVEETLRVIANHDVIVEVNARGWRHPCRSAYPSPWILRRLWDLGIRVTVNSDAHAPSQLLAGLGRGLERAWRAGYREVACLAKGEWLMSDEPFRLLRWFGLDGCYVS